MEKATKEIEAWACSVWAFWPGKLLRFRMGSFFLASVAVPAVASCFNLTIECRSSPTRNGSSCLNVISGWQCRPSVRKVQCGDLDALRHPAFGSSVGTRGWEFVVACCALDDSRPRKSRKSYAAASKSSKIGES